MSTRHKEPDIWWGLEESTKKGDNRAIAKDSVERWMIEKPNVWMATLSQARDRLGDISLRPTNNNLTLLKHNNLSKETHAI